MRVCVPFAYSIVRKPTRRETGVCARNRFAYSRARARRDFRMSQVISGDDVRSSYQSRVNWDSRVLDALGLIGPATTREIFLGGLNAGLKYGRLIEILGRLVDDGKIIATRKPATARGGRPGVVWSLA